MAIFVSNCRDAPQVRPSYALNINYLNGRIWGCVYTVGYVILILSTTNLCNYLWRERRRRMQRQNPRGHDTTARAERLRRAGRRAVHNGALNR